MHSRIAKTSVMHMANIPASISQIAIFPQSGTFPQKGAYRLRNILIPMAYSPDSRRPVTSIVRWMRFDIMKDFESRKAEWSKIGLHVTKSAERRLTDTAPFGLFNLQMVISSRHSSYSYWFRSKGTSFRCSLLYKAWQDYVINFRR